MTAPSAKSASPSTTPTGTTPSCNPTKAIPTIRTSPADSSRAPPRFPAIGCRFKGNSSFRRNGIKKPFKLDFNEYDDNAAFLGLKKLNLNNFDLAPDFRREKLLHDFAGKYVAALRSVYVRLYVNDAFYGLYLAVEQPDKTMMRSRYGDDEDGNLYEAEEQMGGAGNRTDLSCLGPNQSAYENVYLLKTNETANDYSDLIHFLDVLNNTAAADLPARLEPICDVENWLFRMAINNLFVNLDSYLGVAAEHYLYDRSSDHRFVHIQWDHNESFGTTGDGTPRVNNPFTMDPFWLPTNGAGGGSPGGPGGVSTGAARPLLQKLWAAGDYQRLYLRLLARMLREGFDATTMAARVQQLASLIRADVIADPNKAFTASQFETALNSQISSSGLTIYGINQFVRERYAYLRPLLNSYAQPSDVRLNELVTVNSGSNRDEAGDADPWVELHNPQGKLHASWALSADGEAVGLYQTDGKTLIDSVTFGPQQTGVALGRTTDGAATWSIFRPATPGASNSSAYANWIVNAASYVLAPASPASIVSAFGENLAEGVAKPASAELPETMGGVTVAVAGSAGVSRNAPLFYVSPEVVNFVVPPGTAAGRARVTIRRQDGQSLAGDLLVDAVAPGLFSANANGQGVGLIAAVRADASGSQISAPVYAWDAAGQKCVPAPSAWAPKPTRCIS
jgi:hypothetical protein